MNHLHPKVAPITELSEKMRVQHILEELWIGYSRSENIHQKLDFLLSHPRISRMPSLLIVGETNNGKTMLVNRFLKLNKPFTISNDQQLVAPVIYIQAPPVPDEKRFLNAILEGTFTPYRVSDKLDRRQHQVIKVLKTLDVKMLIIDEIHHVLGGSLTKRVSFLNVIKYLSNELKISIVGVGIQDAFNAISTDPQLTNRFEPAVLPLWQYNEEYLKLLASFEYLLPLKEPSQLINHQIAQTILNMSEGTIGEISQIIKRASVHAIQGGKEKIDLSTLKEIQYIPPSERRYNSEVAFA